MKAHLFFIVFLSSTLLYGFTSQEALKELILGNQRFYENRPQHIESLTKERLALQDEQSPMCAIVACADSRVTPEIIFDQPLGRLFVIRVAGNVISEGVMESLSFAVNHLGVPLVVVIGHENCGLIEAVKEHKYKDELGHLESLALPYVKPSMSLEEAIKSNARGQAESIAKEFGGKTDLVEAAYYNFKTGKVSFYRDKKG